MKTYLNAGFGSPLGQETLALISNLGFRGVRQDLPPDQEVALIAEFAPGNGHGLRPLFLVNGGKMVEGPGAAGRRAAHVARLMRDINVEGEIEVGNEPNISPRYGDRPQDVTTSVLEADEAIKAEGLAARLVLGGIMNTDRGGQDYLREMLERAPRDVIVGYHTYRQHTAPHEPSKGFATRGAEFRQLQDIVGGREMWNTEIGWHTAKEKKGWFGKPKGLTDEEVLGNLQAEAVYNARAGATVFTVFQLNDGPGDHYESKFGIRTVSQVLKPSSTIAEWIDTGG